MLAVAALGLTLLPTVALAQAPRAGSRAVSYRGVTLEVPATWPVLRLDRRAGCVRFDRHAVYLGDPARSTCPPHLVGRTEAVHLTTGSLQGVVSPDRVVTADGSRVGVVVSAGDEPSLARRIAGSVDYAGAAADVTAPSGLADARTFASSGSTSGGTTSSATGSTTTLSPRSPSDTVFAGLGFDACTAQPLTTMATWYSASPYKAANMYIGGASRGCTQANLTADWVTQTIAQGWTLIPTYVGLQASCTAYPNRMDPAQAAAQGSAAADDAVAQLNALGLGIGNPVYFDLEAFDYTNLPCLAAAQTFIDQWTVQLHARGYVSGVYSSSNTVKALLVDRQGDATFHQPDDLWFARWNGSAATTGDPAIPDQYWADHQRIHQYRGGHQETWGGITVNIDNDAVDAAVAPSQLAAEGAFVQIAGRGELYRIAGGAPVYVSTWESVGGGPQAVQTLSQTQFDSLPDRPEDGTFLQSGSTGLIWRVVAGVATWVRSWTPYGGPKPTVVVDQAALDNAGTGGVWNLLTSGRPAPRVTGPTTLGTVLKKARFTWPGGYFSSAIATYDVRFRRARWDGTFGAWTRPASWQRTAVTDTPLGLRAGYDYCVSVRARNRAGQRSDWSARRCLARALDDKRLFASSGWKRRTAATFYQGSALSTTTKGATLVRTGARVKRVGLVATTCRSCGTVAVLVDGKRIGRVNLRATSRHRRQVVMLPAFRRQHATITLRVRTSGQLVQVDGLVLSRT
jgi:hypothetical protein